MVLEEAVILVGDPPDAHEDRALHKFFFVGTKSVDGVWSSVSFIGGDARVKGRTMVIPDVYLRNLAVGF